MRENDMNVRQPMNYYMFIAWLIALTASLGALYIGEVLGRAPCVLCWYQRIFMFPLAIMLMIAVYRSDLSVIPFAIPLSLCGAAVATFHTLLYFKIIPEAIKPCTASGPSCSGDAMTLWGFLPLPALALVAFILIFLNLAILHRKCS